MKETIPQFHRNPRFLKTVLFLSIFFVLVFLAIYQYGQQAQQENIEAKRMLIEGAIMSYAGRYEYYPENLQELIDEQLLNFIPKKPDGSEFTYKRLGENGEVVGFELQ